LNFRDPEAAGLYLRNKSCSASERLALAEHGFSLRYSDPAEMRAWCDVALIGLPSDADAHSAALLYGYAGNAHRVAGEFTSAEQLLSTALALDSSEPLLLEFWASLLHDRRRLTEASAALAQAASLRIQRNESLPLASTLLQSAIVLDLTAHPTDAAAVALNAIAAIASQPSSVQGEELLRTGLQNLALYLTDAGRPKDALLVVRHSRALLDRGGFRFQLRVEWLLARISGALGDFAAARDAFIAVKQRFIAEEMLHEIAMVSLDLARHLLPSNPAEARDEVSGIGPILVQLGVAHNSREMCLYRAIISSARPNIDLITELSRLLYDRQRFKNF
jgi:tetratricopeptide (TPR) repeat protein